MRYSRGILICALAVLPLRGADLSNQGLDHGYRQLYNLQFAAAHQIFQEWIAAHPSDPMGPASEAITDLFADMDRLQILQSQFFTSDHDFLASPGGAPDPAFERSVSEAETLAAKAAANDPRALFAAALCHGLRSDYDALILKHYYASLQEMKKGEVVGNRVLRLDPNYADAYLALGIENYILGLRSAPVRWLLRLDGAVTDKAEGLRQLRLTAEKGHYLQPYARILLAIAALRAHDTSTARTLLRGLADEFPLNPLFARELARLGDPVVYTLDPAKTSIRFTLGAFMHTVHGEFKLTRGTLQLNPITGDASGEIVIAAASGESGNAGRDRDMQTKVLESAQFPEIVFTPVHLDGTLAPQGDSSVVLRGSLRLLGASHETSLRLAAHIAGSDFTASTAVEIPYLAWGLKDPSKAFLRVAKMVRLEIATAGTVAGN